MSWRLKLVGRFPRRHKVLLNWDYKCEPLCSGVPERVKDRPDQGLRRTVKMAQSRGTTEKAGGEKSHVADDSARWRRLGSSWPSPLLSLRGSRRSKRPSLKNDEGSFDVVLGDCDGFLAGVVALCRIAGAQIPDAEQEVVTGLKRVVEISIISRESGENDF